MAITNTTFVPVQNKKKIANRLDTYKINRSYFVTVNEEWRVDNYLIDKNDLKLECARGKWKYRTNNCITNISNVDHLATAMQTLYTYSCRAVTKIKKRGHSFVAQTM